MLVKNKDGSHENIEAFNLFAYGSLKKDFHNSMLLKESEYCGEYITKEKFTMKDHGYFPSIFPNDKGHSVIGELYIIDEDTLTMVNHLEGYPTFYDRMVVTLTSVDDNMPIKALAYINKAENLRTFVLPNKDNLLKWSKK